MQKTEKPPKRIESNQGAGQDGSIAQAKHYQKPDVAMASPTDFKAQLIKTIQDYISAANSIQNVKWADTLSQHLTGIEYCFDKLHIEGEQLINISQGALATLERAHIELEKGQDSTTKAELEDLHQSVLDMHQWLSAYQSGQGKKTPPASPPGTPVPPADGALQQLIAALNVNTVSAFLNALQTLNQFLNANPNVVITLPQFYALFDQLDQTFQRLPESFGSIGQGLAQRQTIAAMIAVHRQVNQLYGFLMGRQIIGV